MSRLPEHAGSLPPRLADDSVDSDYLKALMLSSGVVQCAR